jgi:hypothetical protein
MASADQALLIAETIEPSTKFLSINADLEKRVQESDHCIRQAWVKMSKRSMEIGWEGAFLRSTNAWQILGYDTEKSYRAAVGIGRSTWYKMVDLAERFQHLTKEQFISMSIENAEQLAAAPLETRKDVAMVKAASAMTVHDFESVLVLETATRENKPVGEVYVLMKWRVKEAQREVIQRGLKDWQEEHGIDDEGYALELMVAEFRDRPTLIGFLTQSIPMLTREVMQAERVEDIEGLRKVIAAHIHDMGEILKLCCGENLTN